MKKLIVVAALAVCATLANAASFEWKSTANLLDGDGNVATSTTAPAGNIVLVYLGTTEDWSSPTVMQNATVNYASSMGNTTAKSTTTFAFNYEENVANFDASTKKFGNGAIFGVMFQDGGGNLSYLQSGGADLKPTYTITGMANDASTLGAFTYATTSYSATPAPEPTSAMLLLMGGALLGLRRKRK